MYQSESLATEQLHTLADCLDSFWGEVFHPSDRFSLARQPDSGAMTGMRLIWLDIDGPLRLALKIPTRFAARTPTPADPQLMVAPATSQGASLLRPDPAGPGLRTSSQRRGTRLAASATQRGDGAAGQATGMGRQHPENE